jgi:hypothetical protein
MPAYAGLAIASACSRVSSMPCSSLLLRLGHQLVLVLIPQRRSTGTLDDFFHTMPPRTDFTLAFPISEVGL